MRLVHIRIILLISCSFIFIFLILPKTNLNAFYGAKISVPKGANIILELDKTGFFLGENILLHFCLENKSEESFTFYIGGDYRGGTRSNRFKVKVIDKYGNIMPDPDPGFNLGGLGSSPELKNGERWCQSLPLIRYVRIDNAGEYLIEAKHDFGWTHDKDDPLPVGKIKIKLNMPDEIKAKEIVESMYSQSQEESRVLNGQKISTFRDFSALSYPVYLPILYEKAKLADNNALVGLASIATPESTKVLLELSNHPNSEFANSALSAVAGRMPDPKLQGRLPQRGMYSHVSDDLRQEYIDKTWQSEFAQEIEKHIPRLLVSENVREVIMGAFFVESIGYIEDRSYLMDALNAAVIKTLDMERDTWVYPPRRGALNELLRAINILVENDRNIISLKPQTVAGIVVYLTALEKNNEFRPEGWVGYSRIWLKHEIPFVREFTIKNIPNVNDQIIRTELIKNLEHSDVDVQIAACNKLGEFEVKEAKEQILKLFQKTNEGWLINCAINASYKLDSKWETLNIIVNRLNERDHYFDFISAIKSFVIDTPSSGGGVNSNDYDPDILRKLWSQFIKKHEKRLKADKKFSFFDKEISPELFLDCDWNLKDGERWPSKDSSK